MKGTVKMSLIFLKLTEKHMYVCMSVYIYIYICMKTICSIFISLTKAFCLKSPSITNESTNRVRQIDSTVLHN